MKTSERIGDPNFVHLMEIPEYLVYGESKIQLRLWESIPFVMKQSLVVNMENQSGALMLARMKKKFLQLIVKKYTLWKTVHH